MKIEYLESHELGFLDFDKQLLSCREESPKILILTLKELKLCILNILSPRGYVFHDFGIYKNFNYSLSDFYGRLSVDSKFHKILFEKMKSKNESNICDSKIFHFNWSFFSFLGVDFEFELYVRSLHGRQIAIMAPLDKLGNLIDYFESQLNSSGLKPFFNLDENSLLSLNSGFRTNRYFNALSKPLFSIDKKSMTDAIFIAEKLMQGDGINEVPYSFFNPGAISLSPINLSNNSNVELARLRLGLLKNYSPMLVIEKEISNEINEWVSIGQSAFASELESVVEEHYKKYSFMDKFIL